MEHFPHKATSSRLKKKNESTDYAEIKLKLGKIRWLNDMFQMSKHNKNPQRRAKESGDKNFTW